MDATPQDRPPEEEIEVRARRVSRALAVRLSIETLESERRDAFHAGYPVPPHRGWKTCPRCMREAS